MTTLFDLTEFEASILECVDNPDLIGDEDPAYITPRRKPDPEPAPEVHHHWWRAYMRTDVEMTWVCDCGETKTDLSQREYIELWQRHSADMLSSLEAAIASPTGKLVQDYWRRVSIEADILRYIVPNVPDFLPADNQTKKTVAAIAHEVETVAAAIAPNHSAIEEEIPTKIQHPEPSRSPETLKSGYIEEKQIKKNGKLVGIYLYERYREGGKLKSKYIGRKKGT